MSRGSNAASDRSKSLIYGGFNQNDQSFLPHLNNKEDAITTDPRANTLVDFGSLRGSTNAPTAHLKQSHPGAIAGMTGGQLLG